MSAVPKSVLIDVARASIGEHVTQYHEVDLNDYGWKLAVGYRVVDYGTARSSRMGIDGLDVDEGEAPTVRILTLELITRNGAHPLSRDDLRTTDLQEIEETIVQAVADLAGGEE